MALDKHFGFHGKWRTTRRIALSTSKISVDLPSIAEKDDSLPFSPSHLIYQRIGNSETSKLTTILIEQALINRNLSALEIPKNRFNLLGKFYV